MPRVIPAVRAVVQDRGRFLSVRQEIEGDVLWDLPGGEIRHGESPYDTLQREVKDGLGMDVTEIRPLGVWWFFLRDMSQVVCMTFLCRPRGRKVRIDAASGGRNIIEARWVSRDDFMSGFFRVGHGSLKKLISELGF